MKAVYTKNEAYSYTKIYLLGYSSSCGVEMLNMTMRNKQKRKRDHLVELNEPVLKPDKEEDSDITK